ncbi:MAG: hypothetical protein GWO38_04795, partial [Phycisphaerae bacterium]|nr:hypothetical protein [Phycisphaerae bacterium]NIP51041.1 hypothetical protein [Phycisphaerae bacterium]NIX26956.1 hypothetical protein [Phycisphaerae bacterium]
KKPPLTSPATKANGRQKNGRSKLLEFHSIMLESADDPNEVPELPLLGDDDELVVALDKETGEVLS